MSEKSFYRILLIITIIGSLSVIGLVIYTYHLQSEASIISYIANGR